MIPILRTISNDKYSNGFEDTAPITNASEHVVALTDTKIVIHLRSLTIAARERRWVDVYRCSQSLIQKARSPRLTEEGSSKLGVMGAKVFDSMQTDNHDFNVEENCEERTTVKLHNTSNISRELGSVFKLVPLGKERNIRYATD
ncbi:hypothetical protein RF11_11840 [Thelohanellus kitauei]|uniref:Uncharacterized protein n=1 Tax=Thelohanellus kitauei TaxID=669202 RepID=A0A0C2JLH1_THEKT|nr:hypothetical protein RF11_11840 [Thelohanellus kitauei]